MVEFRFPKPTGESSNLSLPGQLNIFSGRIRRIISLGETISNLRFLGLEDEIIQGLECWNHNPNVEGSNPFFVINDNLFFHQVLNKIGIIVQLKFRFFDTKKQI